MESYQSPEVGRIPQKVLVTGGAGFVGSNLVRALLAIGDIKTVFVLDDLFTGSWENLPQDKRIDAVEGSVTDEVIVRKLVKEVGLVFHLAARNIIASTKDPRNDFATNIGGTLTILLAARDLGRKKVVYSSSASVYGNPKHIPITEDEACYTLSPYAVSKLAGEHYCIAFYESYGVPTVCVRYSNVYGPWQDARNPYCGVVAKFFDALMNDRAPMVHGDGQQTRDFTYVEDAVEATILAGLSDRAVGNVLNVGTGVETSVNDLAMIVAEIFGKTIKPEYIERRDIDNIRRRVLNIERIRRVLRWSPRFTLREGLRKTYEWFIDSKRR